jgi:hypothetical protein
VLNRFGKLFRGFLRSVVSFASGAGHRQLCDSFSNKMCG